MYLNKCEEDVPLVFVIEDGSLAAVRLSKNHTRDAHILNLSFFFIFCAYSAAQNLESTVNTKGNLGMTSLGILYTSFTLSSVVTSLVVRGLGAKRALVLCTTGDLLFIALYLKPSLASAQLTLFIVGVFTTKMVYNNSNFFISWLYRIHNGLVREHISLLLHVAVQEIAICMKALL